MEDVKPTQAKRQKLPDVVRLGDLLAKGTSMLGIKPCEGCKQRQQTMNKVAIPRFWRRRR